MILNIKNLSKNYNSTKAVNNLNLKIKKQGIYGLVGENGAGKTTTFLSILDLIKINKGTIEKPKRIGALLQDANLYDKESVFDNLLLHARLCKLSNPKEKCNQLIKKIGLNKHKKTTLKKLSHGYQKLAAIAQAFLADPNLILLDEPTSGFDPKLIHDVRNFIKDNKKNKTILIASHNLETVAELCDYIFIMKKGKIVKERNIKRVKTYKTLEKIFLKAIK